VGEVPWVEDGRRGSVVMREGFLSIERGEVTAGYRLECPEDSGWGKGEGGSRECGGVGSGSELYKSVNVRESLNYINLLRFNCINLLTLNAQLYKFGNVNLIKFIQPIKGKYKVQQKCKRKND
jgi:hypothetical protein